MSEGRLPIPEERAYGGGGAAVAAATAAAAAAAAAHQHVLHSPLHQHRHWAS